jgi:hypothetical protein
MAQQCLEKDIKLANRQGKKLPIICV